MKLMSMNALSQQEMDEEFKILNPLANLMALNMKKIIKTKVQSALVNDEDYAINSRKMF